jgi:hypothetical protein
MVYLGELEDDDVFMFVIEHLRVKDHNSPDKLEGPEPLRVTQNITDLRSNHAFHFVCSERGSYQVTTSIMQTQAQTC